MLSAFTVCSSQTNWIPDTILILDLEQQRLGLSASTSPRVGNHTTANEDDDEAPSAFPALNSQQRAGGSSIKAPPPPPPPTFSFSEPDPEDNPSDLDDEDAPLPPVVIEDKALAAPTSTTKAQPGNKRRKFVIEKGYSQLDWGRLQRSGEDLRVSSL